MENGGNRILLSRQEMEELVNAARHPDKETLERRDRFLEELQRECVLDHDGSDLVMQIPDISLAQEDAGSAETDRRVFQYDGGILSFHFHGMQMAEMDWNLDFSRLEVPVIDKALVLTLSKSRTESKPYSCGIEVNLDGSSVAYHATSKDIQTDELTVLCSDDSAIAA